MNSVDETARLVDWRRRIDPSTPITSTATHVSVLAFQGDRVYKMKRAVRFPFIDLSTPAARLAVADAVDCTEKFPVIAVPLPSVNEELPCTVTFPPIRVPFRIRFPPCTLILAVTAPPRNAQFCPVPTVRLPWNVPL